MAKALLYSDEEEPDEEELRAMAAFPGMAPAHGSKVKGEIHILERFMRCLTVSGLASTGPHSDEEEADEEEMRAVAAFPGMTGGSKVKGEVYMAWRDSGDISALH